jgi:hypothetical protein
LAVSVSSGVPCLGKYNTVQKGKVVLYPAEDAPHIVKGRLEGLCRHHGLELESLDERLSQTIKNEKKLIFFAKLTQCGLFKS